VDIMEWIKLGSALASAIAAALAWAAKLWWGREFAAAKDETIRAKDAQAAAKDEIIKVKDAQIEALNREIESLRELTPMKIREYFHSVKEQLEEYNDLLQGQLAEARDELAKRDLHISRLRSEGAKKTDEIEKLESERQQIAEAMASLERQLETIRDRYEGEEVIVWRMPRIDHSILKSVELAMQNLQAALPSLADYKELAELSASLLDSYYQWPHLSPDDLLPNHLPLGTFQPLELEPLQSAEDADSAEETDEEGERRKAGARRGRR